MGRPAKPTRLKVVQGNPGKRQLPKDEPAPELVDSSIRVPSSLAVEARPYWRPIVKKLVGMGVLTTADLDAVVMYCEACALERQAVEEIEKEGPLQVAASGYQQVSGWYTIRKDARAERMKILSMFGMTPSDRAKVSVVPKPKGKNPFLD